MRFIPTTDFGAPAFFTGGFLFDFGAAAPTPEPTTLVLLAACIAGVGGSRRLKRALLF